MISWSCRGAYLVTLLSALYLRDTLHEIGRILVAVLEYQNALLISRVLTDGSQETRSKL